MAEYYVPDGVNIPHIHVGSDFVSVKLKDNKHVNLITSLGSEIEKAEGVIDTLKFTLEKDPTVSRERYTTIINWLKDWCRSNK